MNKELLTIKKKYGEAMAHLCRELFPTLLETEGVLLGILTSKFNESKFLCKDIIEAKKEEEFKNFIYSFIDVEKGNKPQVNKTPAELLGEAGYDFYECHSEEDIQSFRKYYYTNEELCTFRGGRLDSCHVFFAVKKNVTEVKRENFSNPTRQDEYGTSVISIQFSRDEKNYLSIKNRYNHAVNNPDATFSNNLDNIIPGLSESFAREYNFNISDENKDSFELPNYTMADDGKLYKYNMEIDNTYYCPNNIIIKNGKVNQFDKSKCLLIDYFLINLEQDILDIYPYIGIEDSFIDYFTDIKKIEIINQDESKDIIITNKKGEQVIIKINKLSQIIEYNNSYLTTVGDNFLSGNNTLQEINLPNLTTAGDNFLHSTYALQKISFPELTTVGNKFFHFNNTLPEINLPKLTIAGDDFLSYNDALQEINFPELTTVGNNFLCNNHILQKVNLPLVTTIGNGFLSCSEALQEISLPRLTTVGDSFLHYNQSLQKFYAPKLEQKGFECLTKHPSINLEEIIAQNNAETHKR